jgi:hypothetical protein
MKIWVDDIRTPPDPTWRWCKSSMQTIITLTNYKILVSQGRAQNIEVMSLDHDLGMVGDTDDTSRYIVLWMCNHDFWPDEVRIHSANPVGVEWLEGMISRYQPVANEKCSKCQGLLLADGSHATNDRGPCYGVA